MENPIPIGLRAFHLPRRQPDRRRAEGGYLLASMAVILLITIALLSSYSFVIQRDSRFKSNYAIGQRLADLAVMAHYYAQDQYYAMPTASADIEGFGELMDASHINPPDGFAFSPGNNTTYAVSVRGANQAPVNSPFDLTIHRAASAYIHMKIRSASGLYQRSDMIALLAGANSRGLTRIGIVGRNLGGDCDGTPLVRWGSDARSCLTATQVGDLGFTDVRQDDIIIPAWETSLARAQEKTLFRFPQPERPDVHRMFTTLDMGKDAPVDEKMSVVNAAMTRAGDPEDPDHSGLNALGNVVINTLTVRKGIPASGSIPAKPTRTEIKSGDSAVPAMRITNGKNLRVQNQSGSTAMIVTGDDIVFTIGTPSNRTNLEIVNDLKRARPSSSSPGRFTFTIDTDTAVNNIIAPNDPAMVIANRNATDPAGKVIVNARNICSETGVPGVYEPGCSQATDLRGLNFGTPASRLNVTRNFETNGNAINPAPTDPADKVDIYAGQFVATGTTSLKRFDDTPLHWQIGTETPANADDVGSFEQSGTGRITVKDITVESGCYGRACPDNVTSTGGTGGL